jgi:ParB family chromosome partitioning protein
MPTQEPRQIHIIEVDRINVINPRTRNRRLHQEIVANIKAIGLKRPITVSSRNISNGENQYDLVCGQGRLEAYRLLDQKEIPAFVIDASEEDCLVMSLVENIARRQHQSIDLMREVANLHKRGFSEAEVANKIGVTSSWVNMIVGLLNNGEERLVSAVETGLLPLSLAIHIARSSDAETQKVLADAYENGTLTGKQIIAARKMLERRAKQSKSVYLNRFGKKNPHKKTTPEDLVRLLQREADNQTLLIKKADFTQNRLMFIAESFKELLKNDEFIEILKFEKLGTLPKPLSERLKQGGAL